jgi:hypothetical protein
VRRRRPGRRPAAQVDLSATPDIGFWRRLLGPFFTPAVAVLAAIAVLGGGLFIRYTLVTSPDQAARQRAPRISDTTFERAAVAVCRQYAQVFDTATTLSKEPSNEEISRLLTYIASTFDGMVARLRALPVAPADQAAVGHWLDQWDQYDAFGHQYAAAVARGAERDLVVQDSASQGRLRRDRNAFATANHMSACSFN